MDTAELHRLHQEYQQARSAELALIQLRARIEYSHIGYWRAIGESGPDHNDATRFALAQLIGAATPEIATALGAWGQKWTLS